MKKRAIVAVGLCLLGFLAIWLRVYAIRSDAYARLSWSSALLTDEGFYMHNARNLVLFGRAQIDGFSNMLIMPWLHYLQVIVFKRFGVGVVQDRWISIISSLLSLPLFWFAMDQAFGKRAATIGTIFMALDHSWVLYNRLALMDTPGALVLVAAWACWEYGRTNDGFKQFLGLFLCGAVLGLEYGVRGLGALVWPAPFLAAFVIRTHDGSLRAIKLTWPIVVGLVVSLGVYVCLWWIPYHAQLARVDNYYVGYQLLPHSIRQLGHNFDSAWFYWENGLLGYLVKHTPVMVAILVVWWIKRRKASHSNAPAYHSSVVYLGWWLVSLLAFFTVVNYSPSRYYVLMYPSLFGLAAVAADQMASCCEGARKSSMCLAFIILGWVLSNVYWYQDWLRHISYRQWQADSWLGANLPPNSVIFGDISNGLCMNNHLLPVCVMRGLCNYHDPLARYRDRPEYVLILDGRWKERWWVKHYPGVVVDANRIHVFDKVLRKSFVLGLYKVPRGSGAKFVTNSTLRTHKIAR